MATITSLTAHQLLDIAKDETKKLESGEIFIVRDLFKGYEWNRIERKKGCYWEHCFYMNVLVGILNQLVKLLLDSRNIKSFD